MTSVPRVERLWPDSTVVCIASGPSLTQSDVDYCRDRARVIAVKDAIRMAPWADALYACDARWWKHHAASLSTFSGFRFSIEAAAATWATVLRMTGIVGLETLPSGLRSGQNSGYQAVNLAVHFGARRIVLLGYDMQPTDDGQQHHWFGAHPYKAMTPPYALFLRSFATIVEPLKKLGIAVLNATRRTALDCFPCVSLTEALA